MDLVALMYCCCCCCFVVVVVVVDDVVDDVLCVEFSMQLLMKTGFPWKLVYKYVVV